MPEPGRDVWITGVGIVSSLGEGREAHWQALEAGRVAADAQRFPPYVIHPLAPLDLDRQIPRKGDQRQMEAWQRTGTYAAGLALDDAGLKGHGEILSGMDLIVAAGGGERDHAVDRTLLSGLPAAADPGAFLNERLMNDLRPTLFLAQLPNLLAGNISIVHGVAGSSCTLLGEEAAGIEAVRITHARIRAGQSEVALVGAAYNSERPEVLLTYEFAGCNLKGRHVPVFERGAEGGFALGSLGAFLVLESAAHARGRGVKPLARLSVVVSGRGSRQPGDIAESLAGLFGSLQDRLRTGACAVLSGASGAAPATGDERQFLSQHQHLPVRAPATYLGHGMEAQFPMNIALASLAVERGRLFAAHDRSAAERTDETPLQQVVVTAVGHWRGEGLALVETLD